MVVTWSGLEQSEIRLTIRHSAVRKPYRFIMGTLELPILHFRKWVRKRTQRSRNNIYIWSVGAGACMGPQGMAGFRLSLLQEFSRAPATPSAIMLRKTRTPFCGITGRMGEISYGNRCSIEFVENAIRKPPQQSSPVVLKHRRTKLRETLNNIQGSFESPEELFSKTKPLVLVPPVDFFDILLGFGSENEPSGGHSGRAHGASHFPSP
jgi:hypothetical protein